MASGVLKTEIRVQGTYTKGEFELKTAAIILFVAMYAVMIVRPKWRTLAALITGAIFLITGILPVRSVFNEIDWNVILMNQRCPTASRTFCWTRLTMSCG